MQTVFTPSTNVRKINMLNKYIILHNWDKKEQKFSKFLKIFVHLIVHPIVSYCYTQISLLFSQIINSYPQTFPHAVDNYTPAHHFPGNIVLLLATLHIQLAVNR